MIHPLNEYIKSIVRLWKTSHAISPHHFAHPHSHFINDVGNIISYATNSNKSYTNFYINHYRLRSYNDYLQKIKRGNLPFGGPSDHNPKIFQELDSQAVHEDKNCDGIVGSH